jgi:LPS sulfotransferase NodH
MTAESRKPYDLTGAGHDYPAWNGPPRRTVLICTHPRSGSTLLGEALYFAGGLGCPLEYFHRGFRPGLAARWGEPELGGYVDAAHRHRTDPGGTFAAKLFWSDMAGMAAELDPARFAHLDAARPEDVAPGTYRELAALLAPIFPHAEQVHLERRDRVRQAVSGVTAMQTGLFRVIPKTGTQPPKGEAEYDFGRIDGLVAYSDQCHAHWRNYFAATRTAPLSLTYEALTADYDAGVARVLAYLGSNAAVPPARMQRQADAGNEAFVLRYLREHRARR